MGDNCDDHVAEQIAVPSLREGGTMSDRETGSGSCSTHWHCQACGGYVLNGKSCPCKRSSLTSDQHVRLEIAKLLIGKSGDIPKHRAAEMVSVIETLAIAILGEQPKGYDHNENPPADSDFSKPAIADMFA